MDVDRYYIYNILQALSEWLVIFKLHDTDFLDQLLQQYEKFDGLLSLFDDNTSPS